MPQKVSPLLVEKYDIANKILNRFADLESRHILFSIIKKPKTVKKISEELKIPQSSAYKKIQDLLDGSLILEVKRGFGDNGGIIKYYQSRIDDVNISISRFEPEISFQKNSRIKNA